MFDVRSTPYSSSNAPDHHPSMSPMATGSQIASDRVRRTDRYSTEIGSADRSSSARSDATLACVCSRWVSIRLG
jgi:hypothetical protein